MGWGLDSDYFLEWDCHFEGALQGECVDICATDDGGEIKLVLLIYPEYLMGEPDYDADFAPKAWLNLFYFDEETGEVNSMSAEYGEIERFGVKITNFEYGEPIQNTFGLFY